MSYQDDTDTRAAAVLQSAPNPPVTPDGSRARRAPVGYTRLTVNLRDDLHMSLKLLAIEERVTAGQLIERWIKYQSEAQSSALDKRNRWHSRLYRWLRRVVRRA